MRYLIPSLIFLFSAGPSQAWWGPWRTGYYAYDYAPPLVYGPPVMMYTPYWVVPPCCECPSVPLAPPRVQPSPAPAPMPEKKPMAKGSAAPAETPYSPIAPAAMTTPSEEKPENKLPKTDVPTIPKEMPKFEAPKPEVPLPKVEPPTIELPKAEPPKLEVPQFKPTEAPKLELPSLAVPSVPKLELPPLAIPQVMPEKRVAQFRPAPRPALLPVEGQAPADGKYRVGFFNTTDRDVKLIVNGATVTLPKKSHISANVAKKFDWSMDDGAKESAEIPATAAGLEVVIR